MPTRRMKTYTAETGYVYQYYFVGSREALPQAPESPATEFIFDVTPDRKIMYAVSIFLKPEALDAWAAEHHRRLSDPEQYAAVKMRLLQGLDEIAAIREHTRRFIVDAANLDSLLTGIGIE